MQTKIVSPQDAATVILLRERDRDYEVLLLKRHRAQVFMGGAHVFPGGKLDPGDSTPELLSRSRGLDGETARRLLHEPDLPPERALGLWMAAVRETFEEAGILPAYQRDRLLDFGDPHVAERFQGYRRPLHDRTMSFADFARREDLFPALDLLTPYAHWITPDIESRRFDTRFFVARLPRGQTSIPDRLELTEARWRSPAAALAEHRGDRIVLSPPTLKTLEELTAFATPEEVLAAARVKDIYPILPQAIEVDRGFAVLLPHDPEYTLRDYKIPPRPQEPSRVILRDGKWQTAFAPQR